MVLKKSEKEFYLSFISISSQCVKKMVKAKNLWLLKKLQKNLNFLTLETEQVLKKYNSVVSTLLSALTP